MPVTFRPATHVANCLSTRDYTPEQALEAVSSNLSREAGRLLQTSIGEPGVAQSEIIPRGNGFVDTVVAAYNTHHALVIRPDDVWITILAYALCLKFPHVRAKCGTDNSTHT